MSDREAYPEDNRPNQKNSELSYESGFNKMEKIPRYSSYFQQLWTSNYQLRTTNSQLPTPNCQLPTQNFALILAAGFSTRMGTCKTALPWGDRNLLQYQIKQFLLAGFTPIVVLGSHNFQRQKDCALGSEVVINYAPERGKTSSILTGLEALPPKWSSLFISAVDQPRSTKIYQNLLEVHQQEAALITAPTYAGKLGHPLLFSDRLLPELQNIKEATFGLRQIVQKYYRAIAKVDTTSEVLIDLNTPTNYQMQLPKITAVTP